MNKYKMIAHVTIFSIALMSVIFGTVTSNTWQVIAGFWMMMYVVEKTERTL
jgi:hypothetical protein